MHTKKCTLSVQLKFAQLGLPMQPTPKFRKRTLPTLQSPIGLPPGHFPSPPKGKYHPDG